MSNRSTLDEPVDMKAEVGSRPWCLAIVRKIRFEAHKLDSDAASLRGWIEIAAEREVWRVLGYVSLDSFLLAEAGFTEAIIEAIRNSKPGDKIGDIIAGARENPAREKKGGRPPRSESKEGSKFEPLPKGNANKRVLARLARDTPQLLDKIERGEMTVNQAAIAAGIRKKPTEEEIILKAFRKAQDRLQIVKKIVETLTEPERAVVKDWLSAK